MYLELCGAVIAALDATSKSVGEMWVVDRSNKSRSLITNDADVAKLQTDSLIEATLVDCTHSQQSLRETTEGSYPSKQYIHDHWVSASAGYYAVTGKMTTEEENALLLDIVSAFMHVDDVPPHISAERIYTPGTVLEQDLESKRVLRIHLHFLSSVIHFRDAGTAFIRF